MLLTALQRDNVLPCPPAEQHARVAGGAEQFLTEPCRLT